MISSLCLSMIFSENRFPLFRIMLKRAIMCCGSQVASNGNAISITSRMISVMTNGITPANIVVKKNVLHHLLMTKTFIPTGGWISPSSTVITMITPNQTDRSQERGDDREDDRHRQDDHRHRVHQEPRTRYITMISASTP